MTNFSDLFDYNDWANQAVLAVTGTMTPEQLAEPMPELGGSALDLLAHASRVESAFLALLMDDIALVAAEHRDYAAIRETFANVSLGYRQHMPEFERRLSDRVFVPWFKREFTVDQLLLQVATHSVQHRAGVCAGIARAGKQAPGLDYIMWLDQFR